MMSDELKEKNLTRLNKSFWSHRAIRDGFSKRWVVEDKIGDEFGKAGNYRIGILIHTGGQVPLTVHQSAQVSMIPHVLHVTQVLHVTHVTHEQVSQVWSVQSGFNTLSGVGSWLKIPPRTNLE